MSVMYFVHTKDSMKNVLHEIKNFLRQNKSNYHRVIQTTNDTELCGNELHLKQLNTIILKITHIHNSTTVHSHASRPVKLSFSSPLSAK